MLPGCNQKGNLTLLLPSNVSGVKVEVAGGCTQCTE